MCAAGQVPFDYPVVGSLPVGGTAPAIGRSPASEWIEIVFADAPRGTGWVYAANVSLSTGGLATDRGTTTHTFASDNAHAQPDFRGRISNIADLHAIADLYSSRQH